MMALEALNDKFSGVGSPDYKWANVVIDKEIGNVMDLKKLLNHPKYTETWLRAASNKCDTLFQGFVTTEDEKNK